MELVGAKFGGGHGPFVLPPYPPVKYAQAQISYVLDAGSGR